MEILSELLGSELRVKMMRLFLFNPDRSFDLDDIKAKTDATPREIERELKSFRRIALIKPTKFWKTVSIKKRGGTVQKRAKVRGYALDAKFKYLEALSDFLVKTHSLENRAFVKRLEKAGRVKAVIISGIFTGNAESRLDLFVVGDNLKTGSLDRIVKNLESEMGKEVRYAAISAPDFAYRASMNDKLIRDVLDYPHTVLLDRIGLESA